MTLPPWMNQEAWDAFTEMRKAKGKRAPFTLAAAKRIVYELDRMRREGQDTTDVLWQSVVNGWSGVFPVKRECKAPAHEMFHAEPRQPVCPERKAEIAELLKKTRNNLTTRH